MPIRARFTKYTSPFKPFLECVGIAMQDAVGCTKFNKVSIALEFCGKSDEHILSELSLPEIGWKKWHDHSHQIIDISFHLPEILSLLGRYHFTP